MKKNIKSKAEIISEYLSGGCSLRSLGKKYNIPHRTIGDWVLAFQGRKIPWREKMRRRQEKLYGKSESEPPKEIKLLQKELRKQQMQNKLLEEIIRIGEKQTGIDWRKKFGTKRS